MEDERVRMVLCKLHADGRRVEQTRAVSYCDSNAVDVAYRWKRQGASRGTEVGTLTAVL
jgi:hypothetical protein